MYGVLDEFREHYAERGLSLEFRERGQAHILLLPSTGINKATTITPGKKTTVGALSHNGYNAEFTTDKKLDAILEGFADAIDPKSVTTGYLNECSLEDFLSITDPDLILPPESDDYRKIPFRLLRPNILRKISEAEDLWFLLHQDGNPEGFDPRKIAFFWYESPHAIHGRRTFTLNLQNYDELLLSTAFGHTNYDVKDEDIAWLRSTLGKVQTD